MDILPPELVARHRVAVQQVEQNRGLCLTRRLGQIRKSWRGLTRVNKQSATYSAWEFTPASVPSSHFRQGQRWR